MILRMDAAAPSHRHMLQLQYVQRREDNDDTSFRKVRWAANIIKLWWKKHPTLEAETTSVSLTRKRTSRIETLRLEIRFAAEVAVVRIRRSGDSLDSFSSSIEYQRCHFKHVPKF